MTFLLDDLRNIDVDLEPTEKCKGRVYRYREQAFLDRGGNIHYRQDFRLLKRESCPGCDQCAWMHDTLMEFGAGGITILQENLKDGDKVYLTIINESRDWESGIVDSYDVALLKWEEK